MIMKNRLYIVEGMPCSGKSTTSKYIADLLKASGKVVQWIDEGDRQHPADYEFHSYITNKDMKQFVLKEREELTNASTKQEEGYLIELDKLSGSLFDKALKFKVYDFLEWEVEKPIMLRKWQEFVDAADSYL